MIDRDESALHAVQLSIEGRALLDRDDLVLLDIRDRPARRGLFESRRPDVVFHAAALKHLPLLERIRRSGEDEHVGNPGRAGCRSGRGCRSLREHLHRQGGQPLQRARLQQADREGLTSIAAAAEPDGPSISVRFGNVLRSRGSVLETFRAQIAAGGPVTVTDPE